MAGKKRWVVDTTDTFIGTEEKKNDVVRMLARQAERQGKHVGVKKIGKNEWLITIEHEEDA